MESVRFHLKERIYKQLLVTLDKNQDSIEKNELLVFPATEIFSDYSEGSVVSKQDMLLLIKKLLVTEINKH